MRNLLFMLSLLLTLPALAKELSISIEHPRHERREAFTNSVKCDEKCDEVYLKNIHSLVDLINSGKVPATGELAPSDKYVSVKIQDGEKHYAFSLGMPKVYKGAEAEKFSQVNSLIKKIEFNIARDKANK